MELNDEERELLLAIVGRGEGDTPIPLRTTEATERLRRLVFITWTRNAWRPTGAGRLVAELLRRPVAVSHPAVYKPTDPTVIVGVLGKDCPDGWEWQTTGRKGGWYPRGNANRYYPNDLGMIRPAPRPDVVVSIPADVAERIEVGCWASDAMDALAALVAAACDELQ